MLNNSTYTTCIQTLLSAFPVVILFFSQDCKTCCALVIICNLEAFVFEGLPAAEVATGSIGRKMSRNRRIQKSSLELGNGEASVGGILSFTQSSGHPCSETLLEKEG